MRAAAPLVVLGLSACSLWPDAPDPMPVPVHFAAGAEVDAVRRILVLPFDAAPGVRAENELVRRAFLAELAKVQRFEVAPLPDGAREQQELYQSLQRGRISADALVALGKRYQIDGVLLGTVTGHRPYQPPHLGLRVQLLSLHTGQAVWATEGFYDAADAATMEDVQHYAQSFLTEEASLHGPEIVTLSPAKFAAFVAHRLVGTWRGPAAPQ